MATLLRVERFGVTLAVVLATVLLCPGNIHAVVLAQAGTPDKRSR